MTSRISLRGIPTGTATTDCYRPVTTPVPHGARILGYVTKTSMIRLAEHPASYNPGLIISALLLLAGAQMPGVTAVPPSNELP